MSSRYFNIQFFVFFFTLIFISSSHAESYVAISAFQNKYEEIEIDGGTVDPDEKDSSISVTYGFKFQENLSFELSYIDFGELEKSLIDGDDLIAIALEADGFSGAIKWSSKISDNVSGYAKLGFLFWDVKAGLTWTSGPDNEVWNLFGLENGVVSDSDDGNDFFIGLGFDYSINDDLSLGLNYDMYELEDNEINSLGLKLSLGI